jgi:hypothetical protein
MQAENGFFYNFMWKDHSINKTFRTSVAEPNWWSWRALWVLMEDYKYFANSKTENILAFRQSIEKTIRAIKKNIPKEKGKVLRRSRVRVSSAPQNALIHSVLRLFYFCAFLKSHCQCIEYVGKHKQHGMNS